MDIGIVGAGAAAVGLLDALADSGAAPGSITVFDGSPAVWRGRPYQADLDAVRVNAPPALMSVRASDRDHYANWVRDHRDSAQYLDEGLGQPLLPRAVYGSYLEQTAHAAITRLRLGGWRVSVVNARVTGFSSHQHSDSSHQHSGAVRADLFDASRREGSGLSEHTRAVLHTEDGGHHPVDRAVLCVGSGRPRDHYGLTGAPGYVNEPYPLAHTLTDIAADAHVAVIGSGLTAVDIASALTANGHTGPISLLSRSGVLPYVQQRPVPLTPKHLTPANALRLAASGAVAFDSLVELMRAELADLGQDFDSFAAEIRTTETEEPLARLRRQLAEVDSAHLGRRLLAMAIRVLGPIVWPALNESDRMMLRTEHFRTISSLSSPMVPLNAKILLHLLDSGQLRLRRALTKIEARPGGGFTVLDDTEWTADVVLNAVNPPAYTTPDDTESLISALLATGAAELTHTGGLHADPHTHRLLVDDRPDPTWHVLGNLAATSMFIATNPPGLAAEAAALAHHLTAN